MKILNAWVRPVLSFSAESDNPRQEVRIETETGTYSLAPGQIELALVESGQMCGECLGAGEVVVDEVIFAAEEPRADVGMRKCHCQSKDA